MVSPDLVGGRTTVCAAPDWAYITTFKGVDNKPITPGVRSGNKTDNAASLPM